jgi:hypothetical protein
MMDRGHRRTNAAIWFGLAAAGVLPVDPVSLFLGAAMVSATSSDDYSPDADQKGLVAKLVPGGHRGPTHMPELVAGSCWILVHLTAQRGYGWVGWAITVGWLGHLAADGVFGRIPFLILGGRRVGLGLKTGGRIEGFMAWAFGIAVVPLLVVALWRLTQP